MSAELFDTLKYAEALEQAGFSDAQARAIARGSRDSLKFDELATKTDLRELAAATKSDLRELAVATKADIAAVKADIREVETKLRVDIADVKAEQKIIRWGMALILAGVVSLVLKAFFHA